MSSFKKKHPPWYSTGPVNLSALIKSGKFHLDNQGYLVAENGSKYRIPSGPPEGRPKHFDVHTKHLSDSTLSSDADQSFVNNNFVSSKNVVSLNTSRQPVNKPVPKFTPASREAILFPVLFHSLALIINLMLIFMAIYISWKRRKNKTLQPNSLGQYNLPPKPVPGHLKFEKFAQKNNVPVGVGGVPKRDSDMLPLRGSGMYNQKLRMNNGRRKVDFDTFQMHESSSMSGTSWAYGSELDDRFLPNGSETTDSILKTDSNADRSVDHGSHSQTTSSHATTPQEAHRRSNCQLLLLTIATHLATLGAFLATMHLCTMYAFHLTTPGSDREQQSLEQTICVLTNPLATDTIFAARIYLVTVFLVLVYARQYGSLCQNQCHPAQKTLCPAGPLSMHQKWAYISLSHSLPWALAAGSALGVALLPFMKDSYLERKPSPEPNNFFVYEFNVHERCTKFNGQMDNSVLTVVLLVLLPTSVEIIICILHLLSDSKNMCVKLCLFIGFISFCVSPGLSAIAKLCTQPTGFVLKKLPFFHLVIDPCVCAYLLQYYSSEQKVITTEHEDLYHYEPPTSPIPEEHFAEYPPDKESSNLNICMPISNVNMMIPNSHNHSRDISGLLSACISPNNVKPVVQSIFQVSAANQTPIFSMAATTMPRICLPQPPPAMKSNLTASMNSVAAPMAQISRDGTLKRAQLCAKHRSIVNPDQNDSSGVTNVPPIQPLDFQGGNESTMANGTLAMKAVLAATAAVVAAQKAEQQQLLSEPRETNSESCVDSSSSCACQKDSLLENTDD